MQQIRNEAAKTNSQFLTNFIILFLALIKPYHFVVLSILTAIKFQLFDLTIRIILKIRDTNQVL
jgi:hypothetical protein